MGPIWNSVRSDRSKKGGMEGCVETRKCIFYIGGVRNQRQSKGQQEGSGGKKRRTKGMEGGENGGFQANSLNVGVESWSVYGIDGMSNEGVVRGSGASPPPFRKNVLVAGYAIRLTIQVAWTILGWKCTRRGAPVGEFKEWIEPFARFSSG